VRGCLRQPEIAALTVFLDDLPDREEDLAVEIALVATSTRGARRLCRTWSRRWST
jgi:hypothetical protein